MKVLHLAFNFFICAPVLDINSYRVAALIPEVFARICKSKVGNMLTLSKLDSLHYLSLTPCRSHQYTRNQSHRTSAFPTNIFAVSMVSIFFPTVSWKPWQFLFTFQRRTITIFIALQWLRSATSKFTIIHSLLKNQLEYNYLFDVSFWQFSALPQTCRL